MSGPDRVDWYIFAWFGVGAVVFDLHGELAGTVFCLVCAAVIVGAAYLTRDDR